MSFLPVQLNRTRRSGSRTRTVCRSRPLTAVNSAVLAPIPRASEARTTSVQLLLWNRTRTARRRSRSRAVMEHLSVEPSLYALEYAEGETIVPNRVYALLVGVNDYGPDIEPLDGCLNDVDLVRDYLEHHVDAASLAIEVLTNADATRANVIGRFRSHLGQ